MAKKTIFSQNVIFKFPKPKKNFQGKRKIMDLETLLRNFDSN